MLAHLRALPVVLLICGCNAVSHADTLAPDAEVVTADVVLALAAALDAPYDEALQAWSDAHDRFEADLEPALRHHCGPRSAAQLEYSFGRLRLALDQPEQAELAAISVRQGLENGLRCLARSEQLAP